MLLLYCADIVKELVYIGIVEGWTHFICACVCACVCVCGWFGKGGGGCGVVVVVVVVAWWWWWWWWCDSAGTVLTWFLAIFGLDTCCNWFETNITCEGYVEVISDRCTNAQCKWNCSVLIWSFWLFPHANALRKTNAYVVYFISIVHPNKPQSKLCKICLICWSLAVMGNHLLWSHGLICDTTLYLMWLHGSLPAIPLQMLVVSDALCVKHFLKKCQKQQ